MIPKLAVCFILALSPMGFAFLHGHRRFPIKRVSGDAEDVPSPTPGGVPEHWFNQKLDHFNPADNRYWKQRYYINDTFYQNGGPAFLYIGGEDELQEIYARTGDWMQYAREYHAICFAVEHRYYGQSRPTPYAVSMDEVQVPTPGFWCSGPQCYYSCSGVEHRMCDFDRNYSLDVGNVMLEVMSTLIQVIQYNGDDIRYLGLVARNTYDHLSAKTGWPIMSVSDMCTVLTDKTKGKPLERLADYSAYLANNYTFLNESCYPVTFDTVIEPGKYLDYDSNTYISTSRVWNYQLCIQVGDFVISAAGSQPFGKTMTEEYYIKICEGYFGSRFNKDLITRGNNGFFMNYAGTDLEATNIVYTQGSFDPFRKTGMNKDTIPRSHVIVIQGVGHVAAMLSPSPLDNADTSQGKDPNLHWSMDFLQKQCANWIRSDKAPVSSLLK